jgi:hypothetical protein
MATNKTDDGYPFDTGDWARWTNVKRLNWLRNFRDKLRDKYKAKFGFTDEQIAKLDADVAEMERVVAAEQAAMKLARIGLEAEMNSNADELLKTIDTTGRKALYIPPADILGKKGN